MLTGKLLLSVVGKVAGAYGNRYGCWLLVRLVKLKVVTVGCCCWCWWLLLLVRCCWLLLVTVLSVVVVVVGWLVLIGWLVRLLLRGDGVVVDCWLVSVLLMSVSCC